MSIELATSSYFGRFLNSQVSDPYAITDYVHQLSYSCRATSIHHHLVT